MTERENMEHSKYDFDLDMVNTNSLSLIISRIKRGSTVLEFGPANGRMTRYLKEALDCKVYLVEIDEEAGREALKYAEELVTEDIENYGWLKKYENISFDYITFADVLEHLKEPEKVLINAGKLLRQDGSLIVSVPNLAHNSVIISLLNNEFEYTDTGLLDNTHIHFFTKNSLENIMLKTGFTVINRYATYAPVGSTEIKADTKDVSGIDESFWNTRPLGEVYQYVYEAKKGSEFAEVMDNFLSEGTWHYFARLYFDRGGGFSNDDVISKVIRNVSADTLEFEAVIPENVKKIRFIPFDGEACLLEAVSFTDIVDGEERTLRIVDTNETMKYYNQYIYTAQAPYFDFVPEPGKKFCNVRFLYKLITIDRLAIDKLHGIWGEAYRYKEMYETQVVKYKNELEVSHAENEGLKAQIGALGGRVNQLENQLEEVYNTFVWRNAEKLRRFRNRLFKKR